MERLEEVKALDLDLWRARQTANAVHDPGRIWTEYETVRAALAAERVGPAAPERPAPTFDDVVRIHRMMQDAGLIPPTSEAN